MQRPRLSDEEIIAIASRSRVRPVSALRFTIELLTYLLKGIFTMANESRRRVNVLMKLNADMGNRRVSLEVHPRNNKPDYIMKGTPFKSWLHYRLNVGDWYTEGRDFDTLVSEAYAKFNKTN